MPKILIVDDQACIRQFYETELTEDGYDVVMAADASEAMAQIDAFLPDLVVLDLFLNSPNGWEVLEMIRRKYTYLPVIIATAYDSYRKDPRLNEAAGYIVKHVDPRELKEKVAEVLMQQHQRQHQVVAINSGLGHRKVATA